jgi:hypothetical protein
MNFLLAYQSQSQTLDPVVIEVLVSVATFIASVGVSAFISGMHWGRLTNQLQVMSDRLAKIEGMFTLRLKDPSNHAD